MTTQTEWSPTPAAGRVHRLTSAQALHLGPLGGELTVVSGRVWLTCRDDPRDHVFDAGQRVRLGAGEHVVIEAWDAREGVTVRWNPRRQGFVGAVLAEPFRGLAFLAGRLARRAAATEHWAQGRIGGCSGPVSSRL